MIHLPRVGLGPLCFQPKAVQGFLLKAWPAVVTSQSLPFFPSFERASVSPFQIGLRMHCLSISPSVGSKPIRSDPLGLRIALGAFRTCPAQSLYVEVHELSLASRRLKLALSYILKLKSLPAKIVVFEPENIKLFEE